MSSVLAAYQLLSLPFLSAASLLSVDERSLEVCLKIGTRGASTQPGHKAGVAEMGLYSECDTTNDECTTWPFNKVEC